MTDIYEVLSLGQLWCIVIVDLVYDFRCSLLNVTCMRFVLHG
jgi:hypothetical protein